MPRLSIIGTRVAAQVLVMAFVGLATHGVRAEPPAAAPQASLEALKKATAQNVPAAAAQAALSPVREAALRDTARVLGAQAGLGDESRHIVGVIRADERRLDAKFRFSEMLMGVGILPAVISEAKDAVAIDGAVMRVALSVYRIDEPARPVMVAPTWRDWLLVGLNPDLRPMPPSDPALLPRDAAEQRYWNQKLDEAYAVGVGQARAIFDINTARLERTYVGMRRFYDLYARGMVTAPQVVVSSSVIDREDPNTVAIGGAVFRIVQGTDFVEKTEQWRPLGR